MTSRRCNGCGKEILPDTEYLRVRSSLCKNDEEDLMTLVEAYVCKDCSDQLMYLVEYKDRILELIKKGEEAEE